MITHSPLTLFLVTIYPTQLYLQLTLGFYDKSIILLLNKIHIDLSASSYHEAIWELVNTDATDGDETDK